MTPIAEIVDVADLVKVIWTAALAGVLVSASFAVAILGATRAVDLRRDGRGVEATAFALLGALAIALVAASIVLGIVVMTRK